MTSKRKCNDCRLCPSLQQSIFANLDNSALEQISQKRVEHKIKRGHKIYDINQSLEQIYCLSSGAIRLKTGTNAENFKTVRVIAPGQIFGSDSFVGPEQSHLMAETIEDSKYCEFRHSDILELLHQTPELLESLLKRLSNELRERDTEMFYLSTLNVKQRVARAIAMMAQNFGEETKNGLRISIRLSRSDVASLSATVLESAVRTVSELKSKGIIITEGKHIVVCNLQKLKQIYLD